MNLFEAKLWGVPFLVLAAIALAIAIVYLVWDLSGDAGGWRYYVLRWAHGLVWVCLALAALAKARITPLPETLANPLALVAGGLYLVFLATNFVLKG